MIFAESLRHDSPTVATLLLTGSQIREGASLDVEQVRLDGSIVKDAACKVALRVASPRVVKINVTKVSESEDLPDILRVKIGERKFDLPVLKEGEK